MPYYLAVNSQLPTDADKSDFSKSHVAKVVPALSVNHATYLMHEPLVRYAEKNNGTIPGETKYDIGRDYLYEYNELTANDVLFQRTRQYLQIVPFYVRDKHEASTSIIVRAELLPMLKEKPLDYAGDICVGLSELPLYSTIADALVRLDYEHRNATGQPLLSICNTNSDSRNKRDLADVVASCKSLYEVTGAMSRLVCTEPSELPQAKRSIYITVYLRTLPQGRLTNLPSDLVLDVFGFGDYK